MKQALFPCFLCCASLLPAQQSTIQGVISIHNSAYETGKRAYVPNAQVEDDFQKATAQTTGVDGSFKLVFVGVPEKASVQLIVKKEGLQVVNIDALSAVTGQQETVRLSMAQPEKIAEYRRQIYKVGKTEAEKNLTAQLKKKGSQIETLQHDATKNKADIEKLQTAYAELQAFAGKIEEQAQDLARRYAPVNLDDVTPQYREAFDFFQKGELEKALQLLRDNDFRGQALKIKQKENNAQEKLKEATAELADVAAKKPQLIDALLLKADLHRALFQFDSTIACFEILMTLDARNEKILWAYAHFLSNQRQYARSLEFYNQLYTLVKSPEKKVLLYNQIGNVKRGMGDLTGANHAYREALSFVKGDDAEQPATEALIWNNLGQLLRLTDSLDQSEKAFEKALNKYLFLVGDKKYTEYNPHLALTYNNLGRVYYDRGTKSGKSWNSIWTLEKAGDYFKQALDIYEQLSKDLSTVVIPDDIIDFYDLNTLFEDNDKEAHILDRNSTRLLERALAVHRKFAGEKPEIFNPVIALTLLNLANITSKRSSNYTKSSGYYQEALTILINMARKNPAAYRSTVVHGYQKMGNFYQKYHKDNESALAQGHCQLLQGQYQAALATYEKLKGKKDGNGKDYKAVLLEDFNTLEATGISQQDLARAREEIEKW